MLFHTEARLLNPVRNGTLLSYIPVLVQLWRAEEIRKGGVVQLRRQKGRAPGYRVVPEAAPTRCPSLNRRDRTGRLPAAAAQSSCGRPGRNGLELGLSIFQEAAPG